MIKYTIGSTASLLKSPDDFRVSLESYYKSLDEQIKKYSDISTSNLVQQLKELKDFIASIISSKDNSPSLVKKIAKIIEDNPVKYNEDELKKLNVQLSELNKSWVKKKVEDTKEKLKGKEDTYFKGIVRGVLESTSVGKNAYEYKDKLKSKESDRRGLVDQIRRLTNGEDDGNAVAINKELSEHKETNKLLRKISGDKGDSSGMFPVGMLGRLAGFATSALPLLAGLAIVGSLSAFAYSLYKTVREEDKNNDANRAKNKADIEAREAAKPADQRLTDAQKASAITAATLADNKAASNQSLAGNSDSRKTLNKLKSEYIKKRMPELNADPKYGTGEFNVRDIASKEFDEYINNKGSDKSASVSRLIGDSLGKVANVAPTEQSKALGKTTFDGKPVTVNPAAVSTSALSAKLTDLVNIRPGVDLNGLNDGVKTNLSSMATEYYQQTGKKLRINSAKRSAAEQERLYKEKGPGWAAPPGQSMHEFGYAVDIDPADADQLSSMGLLSKYGFTRPLLGASKPEPWHVEPAGIQGQKSAIRQGGGLASAASSVTPPSASPTSSDTEGATPSGSSSKTASVASSSSASSSSPSSSPMAAVSAGAASVANASGGGTSSAPAIASSISAGSYDRSSYEEPTTSVVVNTPPQQSQSSSSNSSKTSLDSIPMMVENLDMILLNTGSI